MRYRPGPIYVVCAVTLLGMASLAAASPIGTPAANRPPSGRGVSVNHMFDSLVDPHGEDAKDAEGKPRRVHKRLTAKEWREAYIAKHGHDLPSLKHPGH
jgi:hypothetical protein